MSIIPIPGTGITQKWVEVHVTRIHLSLDVLAYIRVQIANVLVFCVRSKMC